LSVQVTVVLAAAALAKEQAAPASTPEIGLALQLELPFLIFLEDRLRARAEGAVVEKDDVGAEEELIAHETCHFRSQKTSPGKLVCPDRETRRRMVPFPLNLRKVI
jgi:hypothetical protein